MLKEILVPLEQIPRVHLVRDVGEVVAPSVGHDHAAARLERLEVVRVLGTEESRRVQRGLIRHDGDTFSLHALHGPLDGARAEVDKATLHGMAQGTLLFQASVYLINPETEATSRYGYPRALRACHLQCGLRSGARHSPQPCHRSAVRKAARQVYLR